MTPGILFCAVCLCFLTFTCGGAVIDSIAEYVIQKVDARRAKRELKEFLDQL